MCKGGCLFASQKDWGIVILSEQSESKNLGSALFTPQAYFPTDEKVGKESPGNFRRFPGPFGRLKGETDRVILYFKISSVSPLRIPLEVIA